MKIGIDARELIKDEKTGIGRFLENFISFIAKHDRGNNYFLYGSQKTFANLESLQITLRRKRELWTPLWDQIILPLTLRKDDIDLFFSPYDKGPIFTGIPFIITIHDTIPYFFPEEKMRLVRRIFYTLFRKVVMRKASLIFTVSEHSKRDILRLWGVSEDKIRVVPNGIAYIFKPQSFEKVIRVKERYGIRGEYVLYVGNFKPHKNLLSLLEAFAILPGEIRMNYNLVMVGKKDRYAFGIEERAKDLGIKDRLVFTGYVDDEVLPALYTGAKVFTFPSLYEGFGLPPLEAMACGTPVISSKTSSLPEVIGDAGIMVDPEKPVEMAEAIRILLLNEALHRELKCKGLKRAELFRIEKVATKIVQSMEEIIKANVSIPSRNQ